MSRNDLKLCVFVYIFILVCVYSSCSSSCQMKRISSHLLMLHIEPFKKLDLSPFNTNVPAIMPSFPHTEIWRLYMHIPYCYIFKKSQNRLHRPAGRRLHSIAKPAPSHEIEPSKRSRFWKKREWQNLQPIAGRRNPLARAEQWQRLTKCEIRRKPLNALFSHPIPLSLRPFSTRVFFTAFVVFVQRKDTVDVVFQSRGHSDVPNWILRAVAQDKLSRGFSISSKKLNPLTWHPGIDFVHCARAREKETLTFCRACVL